MLNFKSFEDTFMSVNTCGLYSKEFNFSGKCIHFSFTNERNRY